MPKLDTQTILLAFVVVTGLAILMQTIILLAIFVTVRKAARSIREEAEDLRSSVMPAIYNARDLITSFRDLLAQVTPNIESAANDLSSITGGLRRQSEDLQVSALEILDRVRRQSSRLDDMFTALLDSIDRAGGFVAEMVSAPVRQISGALAAIKAVIESLGRPETQSQPPSPAPDNDTFV